jgi:hypothetical protein
MLLSIHARSICAGEMAVAVNELGASIVRPAATPGAASPENRIAVRIVLRARPRNLNLMNRLSRAEKFPTYVTESVLGSVESAFRITRRRRKWNYDFRWIRLLWNRWREAGESFQ